MAFWGASLLAPLIRVAGIIAYTYFTQLKMSASVGKKVFGLKVVGETGQDLTQAEVVRRIIPHSVAFIVTAIPFLGTVATFVFLIYYVIVQLIMAAVGDFRTLRDSATKTRVVQA